MGPCGSCSKRGHCSAHAYSTHLHLYLTHILNSIQILSYSVANSTTQHARYMLLLSSDEGEPQPEWGKPTPGWVLTQKGVLWVPGCGTKVRAQPGVKRSLPTTNQAPINQIRPRGNIVCEVACGAGKGEEERRGEGRRERGGWKGGKYNQKPSGYRSWAPNLLIACKWWWFFFFFKVSNFLSFSETPSTFQPVVVNDAAKWSSGSYLSSLK